MKIDNFKFIVVGSGWFGATIAERIASEMNETVLVIDKRDHVGGNSYSENDKETGIEYHKYGSHIFHTSYEDVWKYINRFSRFNNYRHKVYTEYQGRVFQMPISLHTINTFYGKNLRPFEVNGFIKRETEKTYINNRRNFEDKSISLIGRPLYEAFIEGYTRKQWGIEPKSLPSSIISRLPFRNNYNNDYFDDLHQGIPETGYGCIFKKMLRHKNIHVWLNTDFFEIRGSISDRSLVIYTGPVDRFFHYKHGMLNWRTLSFSREIHKVDDYQGTSVMNFADQNIPYTRIHEFKHFHPERNHKNVTLIFKEFSSNAKEGDELYYPVNTDRDKRIFKKYKDECGRLRNVIFGGRLGTYKYLDMDDAIKQALDTYESRVRRR